MAKTIERSTVFIALLCLVQFAAAQTNQETDYIKLANEYIDKNDFGSAVKILSLGIQENPELIALYDIRGTLLEAAHLYNEAIQDFSSAIERVDSDTLKAHLLSNRGGCKARIMDFEGAYADLIQSVELDPTNLHALSNLAAVCDEVGKPEDTINYLERIIELDPTYSAAYINLGFKFQLMNDHIKAISYFNKAIDLDSNPLAYSNRSYSKLKLNDIEDALEDINISINRMPSNAYAYKIRALIEIQQKNFASACQDLDLALEMDYTVQYGNEVLELKAKHCK